MVTKSPERRTVEVHGYALRVIREARGRKVAEFAEAVGVERSYIARIETGNARRVSAEVYARILSELLIEDYRALLAVAPERMPVAS